MLMGPARIHRGKSCRTITFEQFQEALEELAKKRFKDKSSEEAVREVHRLIEGRAPVISGVTVSRAGSGWAGPGVGGAGFPQPLFSGGHWLQLEACNPRTSGSLKDCQIRHPAPRTELAQGRWVCPDLGPAESPASGCPQLPPCLARINALLPTFPLQKAVSSPTVSRLTDTTKFTGSHKERFDPSGKGKGKAGRVDLVDESGYVPGYKHAGTYDQKVQGGK